MSRLEFVAKTATILIAITLIASALYIGGANSTVVWHDLGKVTGLKNYDQIVWSDSRQAYSHDSWTAANVTTTSHGAIHFDSRGSCPLGVFCANMDVLSWHLNQTLGIVFYKGGWYTSEDP